MDGGRASWAEPPTLMTERFVLRPHRLEDFPANLEMWNTINVGVESGLRPLTREEAWGKFTRGFGFWVLHGRGPLGIIDRETGEYLGEVGVSDFNRDLAPSHDHMPEFSWAVTLGARRRGVASEAVARMAAWADENIAAARCCCLIDVRNAPSIRVAEKAGFAAAYAVDYKGSACTIFERPRRG